MELSPLTFVADNTPSEIRVFVHEKTLPPTCAQNMTIMCVTVWESDVKMDTILTIRVLMYRIRENI